MSSVLTPISRAFCVVSLSLSLISCSPILPTRDWVWCSVNPMFWHAWWGKEMINSAAMPSSQSVEAACYIVDQGHCLQFVYIWPSSGKFSKWSISVVKQSESHFFKTKFCIGLFFYQILAGLAMQSTSLTVTSPLQLNLLWVGTTMNKTCSLHVHVVDLSAVLFLLVAGTIILGSSYKESTQMGEVFVCRGYAWLDDDNYEEAWLKHKMVKIRQNGTKGNSS